jgi:phosphoribosyl 1,2-cyclic phosphate phosphodiesterase
MGDSTGNPGLLPASPRGKIENALEFQTTDIRGQAILRTGIPSAPSIGCGWRPAPAQTAGQADAVQRPSLPWGLIDTRRYAPAVPAGKVGVAHAVLYTHEHADHIFARRPPCFRSTWGIRSPSTARRIRTSFSYAFTDEEQTHHGAVLSLSSAASA